MLYDARAVVAVADDGGVRGVRVQAGRRDAATSRPRRWCWPPAASRPTPSGAPATSARAGTWPRCAAPASTPATASAWRSTSAPCRPATGRAATPWLGPQRAGVRRPRGRRRLPEALLPVRHHGQRRRRALRRRGRRLPQLHLRQVRPRDPEAAAASSPGRSSTPRSCTCCATSTASGRSPRSPPTRSRSWRPSSRTSTPRGARDHQRLQRRGPAPRCRSTPTSRTAAAPTASPSRSPTGPTRSTRRRSRPTRSPAASPSPSAACRIDPTRRGARHRRPRHPRPLRGGRAGRRPLLLQLSGRHGPDGRRGVRADRRGVGGPGGEEYATELKQAT